MVATKQPHILIPIPARDFDPTEVAVTYTLLTKHNFNVTFATPTGTVSSADDMMVTGRGLDPWGWIPGLDRLVLVGRFLRANPQALHSYSTMLKSQPFTHPIAWADIDMQQYDGIVLPGGHRARGMRQYLESATLQQHIVTAFNTRKPVGSICHGTLLVARSIDPATGRSVLYGRQATGLTWALESTAAGIARWTRFWQPDYYRTYTESPDQPAGYMSVQQEVERNMRSASDFKNVPADSPNKTQQTSGMDRDTEDDSKPAFVVVDGKYVSARWPGDVHTFVKTYMELFK